MLDWVKKNIVALAVAVAALAITAPFVAAQSVDLFLGRALKIDGTDSTTATDRAIAIAGDDGTLYQTIRTDSDGHLQTDVLSSVGAGSMTDDAAFTPATSTITAVGGTFDDTAPDSVDEGDGGAFRMSANRSLYVELRDGAGNERAANVDASSNLQVILAANSGVDVGDVDVTSFPDNEPFDLAQLGGNATDTGNGAVGTGTLRVTVATDSTGVLSVDDNGTTLGVDDNGGSLTVDGIVEVQGDEMNLGTVTPGNVTCDADDSDGPTHTFNAATVAFWISNTDTTNDVCVTMGSSGGGDATDPSKCDILFGPWAGSGAIEQWHSPSGARYGGETFRCEAPAGQTAVLVISEVTTE